MRQTKHVRGTAHHSHKLSEDDVRAILLSGEGGRSLAATFGVDRKTIAKIRHGTTWSHINRAGETKGPGPTKGKLTDDVVRGILLSAETGDALARRHGVVKSVISNIRLGKSYRGVTGL